MAKKKKFRKHAPLPMYGSTPTNTNTNPYTQANNPQVTINNYEERLALSGVSSPAPKSGGTKNLLFKALDILDRPRNAVANGLEEIFSPNTNKANSIGGAMMNGLTGKNRVWASDWLPQANGDGKLQGKEALWGALGFVGDVLLDPLTYTGVGALKSVGVNGVRKIATSAVGKALFKDMPSLATRAAAEGADDIARITGKSLTDRVGTADFTDAIHEAKQAVIASQQVLKPVKESTVESLSGALGLNPAKMKTLATEVPEMASYKGFRAMFGKALANDPAKRAALFGTIDETGTYIPGELSRLSKYLTTAHVKTADDLARGINPVSQTRMNNHLARQEQINQEFTDIVHGIFGDDIASVNYGKLHIDLGVKGNKLATLAKESDNLTKAIHGVGKAKTEVTYVSGLQQIVDTANKTWHFKFMGKPLFQAEPVRKVTQAVGEAVYNHSPRKLQKAYDNLAGIFDPHYVSLYAKKIDPAKYEVLIAMSREVTRQSQLSSGMTDSVTNAITAHYALDTIDGVDTTLLKDKRYADVLGYKIEAEAAEHEMVLNDELLEYIDTLRAHGLEVTEDVGKPLTAGELKLRQITIDRYQELASKHNFTIQDIDYLNKASMRYTQGMQAIGEMDNALGVMYKVKNGYFSHFYEDDLVGTRNVATMYQSKTAVDELSGKLANAEERAFYSMAVAEKAGKKPVTDFRSVHALRLMDSKRVWLHKDFIDTLTGLTGVGTTAKGKKYVSKIFSTKNTFDKSLQKVNIPGFEQYFADPEVVRQIQRMRNVFLSNEALDQTLRYLDLATNVVKRLQTSMSPSFVARNLVGETFMNFLAKVGIGAHTTAGKVLMDTKSKFTFIDDMNFVHHGKPVITVETVGDESRLVYHPLDTQGSPIRLNPDTGEALEAVPVYPARTYKDIKNNKYEREALRKDLRTQAKAFLDKDTSPTASPKFKIGGKDYYSFELHEILRSQGLKHTGITRGNLVEGFENTLKQGFSGTPAWKVWEFPVNASDTTETYTRLAHLIQRLDDGYSVGDAASDVRKYHVDYKDLTPTERGLFRRVMPYYTYMRKNTPIQLRQLVENPGVFSALGRAISQSNEALGNPEAPEYLKRNLALPISRDGDNVRYLNLNMPINDVGRIQFELDRGFKENVIDMLHPALKSLVELQTNQSLTFGTPIERYEGEKAAIIPGQAWTSAPKEIDYALQQMGVLNQARMFVGDMLGNEPTTAQGVPLPKQLPFLSSLAPLKDTRQVEASKQYERRDQLSEYIKKMNADGVPVMEYEQLQDLKKGKSSTPSLPFSHPPII